MGPRCTWVETREVAPTTARGACKSTDPWYLLSPVSETKYELWSTFNLLALQDDVPWGRPLVHVSSAFSLSTIALFWRRSSDPEVVLSFHSWKWVRDCTTHIAHPLNVHVFRGCSCSVDWWSWILSRKEADNMANDGHSYTKHRSWQHSPHYAIVHQQSEIKA